MNRGDRKMRGRRIFYLSLLMPVFLFAVEKGGTSPGPLSMAFERVKAVQSLLQTPLPDLTKVRDSLREALHYLRLPVEGGYKFARIEPDTGSKTDIKEGWKTLSSAKLTSLESEPQPVMAKGGPSAVVSVYVPQKRDLFRNNGDVYLKEVTVSYRMAGITGEVKREVKKWLNRGESFPIPLPLLADEVEVKAYLATREADLGKTVVDIDSRSGKVIDSEENPDFYLVLLANQALQALEKNEKTHLTAYVRALAEILQARAG